MQRQGQGASSKKRSPPKNETETEWGSSKRAKIECKEIVYDQVRNLQLSFDPSDPGAWSNRDINIKNTEDVRSVFSKMLAKRARDHSKFRKDGEESLGWGFEWANIFSAKSVKLYIKHKMGPEMRPCVLKFSIEIREQYRWTLDLFQETSQGKVAKLLKQKLEENMELAKRLQEVMNNFDTMTLALGYMLEW